MPKAVTVLGEIDSKNLKITDMHEHTLADFSNYNQVYKNSFAPIDDKFLSISQENMYYLRKGYFYLSSDCMHLDSVELLEKEIEFFKNSGGSTILDVSPTGVRGSVKDIAKISKSTGVNIIVSTGLYADKFWPACCQNKSVEQLVSFMKGEIENGIDGTDIKAGLVKIACNSFNENEQKSLKAGAITAADTGYSFCLHTGGWTEVYLGIEDTKKMLSEVFKQGVKPERVLACHMDMFIKECLLSNLIKDRQNSSNINLDSLKEILDTGTNIVFDFFGISANCESVGFVELSDYERISAILELFQAGYSKQILFGSDVYVKIFYRHFGGNGYTRILDYVVPTLKEYGAKEEDIQNVLVNNPIRLLSVK